MSHLLSKSYGIGLHKYDPTQFPEAVFLDVADAQYNPLNPEEIIAGIHPARRPGTYGLAKFKGDAVLAEVTTPYKWDSGLELYIDAQEDLIYVATGTDVVEVRSLETLQLQRALGIILAIVATVSASLGNVVSARNQRNDLPVIQTNAYGMLYGAIFMFVLALFRGAPLQIEPTMGYLVSLLYLAIFGSVIAFGSYLTLLGRIGLDRAAYVTVLFPIIALMLSTLFEGLTWGFLQLGGVALVLVGNALVLNKHFKLNLSAPFRREAP